MILINKHVLRCSDEMVMNIDDVNTIVIETEDVLILDTKNGIEGLRMSYQDMPSSFSKISMIKEIKLRTDWGLREAKEFCDLFCRHSDVNHTTFIKASYVYICMYSSTNQRNIMGALDHYDIQYTIEKE
jgi:hypothetical protein